MRGNWHNARKNTRARPRMIGLEAIYRFPAGIAITVREEKAGRKEALLDGHFFRIFPRNLNDWRRVETVKGRSDDKTIESTLRRRRIGTVFDAQTIGIGANCRLCFGE